MQPTLVAAGAVLAAALVVPSALQEQAARTPAPPSGGLAWADVDVDGLPDLLARDAGGALVLLRNAGDGGFADVTASYRLEGLAGVRHAAWKDADGDGLADLLVLDSSGRPTLLHHMGAFFVDATAGSGLEGLAGARVEQWLDFDGDGRDDLLLAGADSNVLLRNLGELRFEQVELPIAAGAPAARPLVREASAERTADTTELSADAARGSGGDARRPVVLEGSGGSSSALGVGGVARAPARDPAGGIASVNCVPSMLDQAGGPCLEASSTPLLGALYPQSIHLNVAASGNVGIGTTSPLDRLHVAGGVTADGSVTALNPLNPLAVAILGFGLDANGAEVARIRIGGSGAGATNGLDIQRTGNASLMRIQHDGRVGIGTATPSSGRVEINAPSDRALFAVNNSTNFATGYFINQGTGPAGVFDGSVTVIGSLAKSGGSFRIDHPLDPANKYLYHSFVESPDMMNIYNGNVITDADGSATIDLPDWFESLNRDFRYQLTVVDESERDAFVLVKVVRKLVDNRFAIRTSLPHVEVSWQITGIRKDPWAEANRIPVEQDKPDAERGRYLHPEVYGRPKTESIGSADVIDRAAGRASPQQP